MGRKHTKLTAVKKAKRRAGPALRGRSASDVGERELAELLRRARAEPARTPIAALRALAGSRDSERRLRCLLLMRAQIERGRLLRGYPAIARPLIADAHNTCRWQAMIVIGQYIEIDPDMVWRVVLRHGASDDEDMRAGVGCVLLEHLLEHHRSRYLPSVKKMASRSARFADTCAYCWDFRGSGRARTADG